jgi:hypothetical protein
LDLRAALAVIFIIHLLIYFLCLLTTLELFIRCEVLIKLLPKGAVGRGERILDNYRSFAAGDVLSVIAIFFVTLAFQFHLSLIIKLFITNTPI